MGDSIRTLFVKLSYDVDTTGADRFASSFNRLTGSLNKVSRNYGKTIDGMKEKNRRFVVTAGDLAGAISKIASAGKKIFVAFGDIQQARVTLGFRTSKKEADRVIESVANITKATGGYVSQLDALNAITFGGNITDQMGFFEQNLSKIIKLSKVANKDFKETSDAIAQFIATGTGLDRLVDFEVISASEKQALEKQGVSKNLEEQGIEARTVQAQVFLTRGAAKVDVSFEEFKKTGGAVLDKLSTTVEDTTIVIGKKLNPAITKLATALDNQVEEFKKGIEEGGIKLINTDAPSISEQFDAFKSLLGFGGDDAKITDQGFIGNKNTANKSNEQTTINQTNTVSIVAPNDNAPEFKKIVREELGNMSTKANQAQASKIIPKAVNAHVQAAQ